MYIYIDIYIYLVIYSLSEQLSTTLKVILKYAKTHPIIARFWHLFGILKLQNPHTITKSHN